MSNMTENDEKAIFELEEYLSPDCCVPISQDCAAYALEAIRERALIRKAWNIIYHDSRRGPEMLSALFFLCERNDPSALNGLAGEKT
jgi:hypothetical protein